MIHNTRPDRQPAHFHGSRLPSKPEAYLIDFENELSMQEITVPIDLLLPALAERWSKKKVQAYPQTESGNPRHALSRYSIDYENQQRKSEKG
jgi:hypothetical protein